MKVEVLIPHEMVLRRQHRTSRARGSRANRVTFACSYFPTIKPALHLFLHLGSNLFHANVDLLSPRASPLCYNLCGLTSMADKIALITGSSSGFGLLTSIELAKAGFRVVATMRDLGRRQRLDQAAAAAGLAEQLDIRSLDVTDFDALPAFVDAVVHDYGHLDVLINNAGFAVAGFAEDIKLEELRCQFETNFFGAVAMTKAALPTMRRQRSGHIIMVSSIAGLHGSVTVSSYSASKHALEGWSESLRLEINSLGIKVVLIEPGAFQTDIWTRGAVMGANVAKETSPNLQRSLRMRDRVQALPKRDPIEVARVIVSVAQDPNPKLRYVVGRDSKVQLALKRILPWKWHEKLVANLLKID